MAPEFHPGSCGRSGWPKTRPAHRAQLAVALGLVLALILGSASAATGQGRSPAELVRWTTRALGQLIDGDLTGAVRFAAKARKVVALPELDALVGLVGLTAGSKKEALAELTAAIEHGSTEPMVFYWTARAAWSLGQKSLAEQRMHQAATLAPRSSTIMMGQTLILEGLGHRARAAKALAATAALEPNLLDPILYPSAVEGAIGLLGKIIVHPARLQVLRTQGYLYWRARRVTAALRSFRTIVDKRPRDGDALQMIARCQMALGQKTLALATAHRAAQLAPDHPQALATRGEILLDGGEAEAAIKDLQSAADQLPRDGRLLTRLAEACAEAEKPKCARKYFAYAVERDKENAQAHYGLALSQQQDHQWDKAEASYKRAISLSPTQSKYYQAYAHLARLQGKIKKANRLSSQARVFAGLVRRYARTFRRIRVQILGQVEALSALAAHPQCLEVCKKKVRKMPGPARGFLRIHLAAKGGRIARAQQLALSFLERLHPAALLLRNPILYEYKAKTASGQELLVRNLFPLVLPWHFYQGNK